MDETTLSYLVAELAFQLDQYENSLKMLSKVLMSKNVSGRIHGEALELKERIKNKLTTK